MTTKLDMYNYEFKRLGHDAMRITNIYIHLLQSRDMVDIADISTEITGSDGNIYVEGRRFKEKGISVIYLPDDQMILDISVEYV